MTKNLSKLLSPNGRDRAEQFPAAWAALLDPHRAVEERANAKCWLTYRTTDGEVPYKDWLEQIQPVNLKPRFRWVVSQAAADMYVRILQGNERPQHTAALFDVQSLAADSGSILSVIRMNAIIAYDLLLTDKPLAGRVVAEAFRMWQGTMGAFDPMASPYRWEELGDDYKVLMALSHIAYECGTLKNGRSGGHKGSPERIFARSKDQHWMKCMVKLRKSKGLLW